MAEKLKSILRQTSWSLVLKAAVFGVAWWALPFWLFLLIALYLYFVPITGAGKVSVPFFVLLLAALFQGQSILAALIFGAIFYFIVLIKDFIIIDRRSAYEIIMLVLSYLLMWSFFSNVGGSLGWHALVYSLVIACAVSVLVVDFIKNFSLAGPASVSASAQNTHVAGAPSVARTHGHGAHATRSFRRMLGWMIFLLMWQLLLVGLFLPLNFLYQSAIVFLVAIIIIDLVPQYLFGELSRMKVLVTGIVLFALLVVVVASARWGL
jgi:hypothetical protein